MLVDEVDVYRVGVRRLSTLAALSEVGVRDLATRCLPRFDEVNAAVDDVDTYNALPRTKTAVSIPISCRVFSPRGASTRAGRSAGQRWNVPPSTA
jgi:hypothetical protein